MGTDPATVRINLLAPDNLGGLSQDARLLRDILVAAGHRVTWITDELPSRALRVAAPLLAAGLVPRAHLNVFLEQVFEPYLPWARCNALIPNPEWTRPETQRLLDRLDVVLAKTETARRLFESIGRPTRFLGFTGEDRWAGTISAGSSTRVLHLAGRSRQKGTAAVLEVWRRHPEWPALTLVRWGFGAQLPLPGPLGPNVRVLEERLSEEAVRGLQRSHGIHACPSETEGFGHTLVEAMSCGAVVVTTDAPPMNELVGPDRGVLVRAGSGGRQNLGDLYHVSTDALEMEMARVLTMSTEERACLGRRARAWFEENDREFRVRLPQVIAAVVQG